MSNTVVTQLRTEYRDNPLGIDIVRPRFSWRLDTDRPGARQVAYRIVADGWDSGRVESDQSIHVPWDGPRLGSGKRVGWRVTVWDETGAAVESEPAFFEMGLLNVRDWRGAQWIGGQLVGGAKSAVPCPYLRRTFRLPDKPIATARLYVTALGVYEARLNGQRVGTDELAPGWTDFDRQVRYQTHDVAALLKPGENALGTILGDGWYCGHTGWKDRQTYGERPKLLALLEVTYADGTRSVVRTDRRWRHAYGPLIESDMMMGEAYDARRELGAWDAPGYRTDGRWSGVALFPHPAGLALVAQNGPTITATQELTARHVHRHGGEWIVDLGINLVGKIRLKVKGPAGTTVRLRYAEVLAKGPLATDGPIYTTNLRAARNVDVYTLKGDPDGEVWETRFTFHGFRYVELSGFPGEPGLDTVTGIVLHSDCPTTGGFECSDDLVNQLQKNIDWGQRGNWVDVPTDCPQRDERLGWTGDAQVFVRTACFNRDVAGFFHKWCRDLRDAQSERGSFPSVAPNKGHTNDDGGPAWADAGVICPWTVWLCYGDERILEDNYTAMRRFVDWMERTSPGLLRCLNARGFHWGGADGTHCYGDWLALDGSGQTVGGTPFDLIGTAFFAHCARLLSQTAARLGKKGDAGKYDRLFQRVRAAFRKRYITDSGLIIGGTQTAYVLALHFDLAPEKLRDAMVQELVHDIRKRGYKTTTGFVGSPYLPHVLTAAGERETMYRLLFQKAWPSYLFAVTQGATTIWERWDGWTAEKGFQDPGMNSFNHYAYGAIGSWLYQCVAGIDLDEAGPGYKRIVLKPFPPTDGALTRAKAYLDTLYGRVESGWEIEGGNLNWSVVVPPNTTAEAHVPGESATRELAPGRHAFSVPWG